jgi:chaperonin GroES
MYKIKRTLYHHVVVKPDPPITEFGGIIIPGSGMRTFFSGTIINIGSGALVDGKLVPLETKVGDKVLYGEYSGQPINFGGEELLHMRENEIFAILEED